MHGCSRANTKSMATSNVFAGPEVDLVSAGGA